MVSRGLKKGAIFEDDGLFYIVKQVMVIQKHKKENNVLISHDTYYRRTPKRDLAYNLAFQGKRHINGKRLPSNNYTRTYVQ